MTNKTSGRRRHSPDLKAQILAECEHPGASVAAVAMAHGINANLVHKWRWRAQKRAAPAAVPVDEFIALPMPPAAATGADLRLELRRGGITVTVSWPASAAVECAAWLREVWR